jgi:hypothetical protein
MRINRCWILAAGMSLLPMLVVADSRDEARAGKIRWDIIHIVTFSPMGNTIDAGGKASALAQNNSMITVTGSGTFRIGDSDDVTGGGTWQTFDPPPASTPTGAGNYRVTGLVRFEVAPGAQASNAKDLIGDGTLADNRGGLAILRIAYSDGSKGILVVSCDLPGNPPPGPAGSPDTLFEGITASKGFVDYWNREAPVAKPVPVDGNRTLFHVVSADKDD